MTALNMGDRPASAIAQTALKKTAQFAEERYPDAAQLIIDNSYMDDIPGSVPTSEQGNKVMKDAERLLAERGFNIKGWRFSGQKGTLESTETQRAVQVL